MNTMADLRRECATRLRDAVHGKEINMEENRVTTPHMLGIVPIGAQSNHRVESGTLLDCNHEFWDDFEEEVNTPNGARNRIESAIRSLKKDDIFRMTYPYGEEWQDPDIVYCEVDELQQGNDPLLETKCAECGNTIEAPLSLDHHGDVYALTITVDCPHCDFSRNLERGLFRQ